MTDLSQNINSAAPTTARTSFGLYFFIIRSRSPVLRVFRSSQRRAEIEWSAAAQLCALPPAFLPRDRQANYLFMGNFLFHVQNVVRRTHAAEPKRRTFTDTADGVYRYDKETYGVIYVGFRCFLIAIYIFSRGCD